MSPQVFAIAVPNEAGPLDVEDLIVPLPDAALVLFCDDDPLAIASLADAGTGLTASRCDHVHPYTGLATDAELAAAVAAEAVLRAAADAAIIASTAPASHMTQVLGAVGHHPSRVQNQAIAALGAGTLGDIRYVTDGARGLWLSRGSGFYSSTGVVQLTDFDAVADGVSDNLGAFEAAVTAAVALGAPLFVPAGTYNVVFTALNPEIFYSGDLTIIGAGIDRTIIKHGLDDPAFLTSMIECRGGGTLRVGGLTLQGPDTLTGSIMPRAINCDPASYVCVDGVKLTGKWGRGIKLEDGAWVADIRNCEFTTFAQSISANGTGSLQHRYLNIDNCHFKELYSTSGQDHAIYPNPGVSLSLTNSRFENIPGGFAVHMNGSTTLVPKYWRVADCSFASTVFSGVRVSEAAAEAQITNCDFHQTLDKAVSVIGSVEITDCTFKGSAGTGGIVGVNSSLGAAHVVSVRDCRMTDCGISPAGVGTEWNLSDVKVEGTGSIGNNEGSPIVTLNGVRMKITNGAGVRPNVGTYRIGGGSTFVGDFAGAAAIYKDQSGTATVELDGVTIDSTDKAIVQGGGAAGTIHCRNSDVNGTVDIAAGLTAAIMPRPGIGAALASAATLAPSFRFDTYHVTGTATINNIRPQNDVKALRGSHGYRLVLIADGAWTLAQQAGGTGDIHTKTGANRTVAANEVVTLLYDATVDDWFEVA